MFKKLDTSKKKVAGGVITGVVTFSLSFTVLASVFGLDNLLSAIINPITKKQELIVTVNEKIDMIEVWDGSSCSLGSNWDALIPANVFDGGSGTESDPYQIKTADQLVCFMLTVNYGIETYDGKYVKQTKDIKLNDNLISNKESGNDDYYPNVWISIGNYDFGYYFGGTYDGDDHTISGLYLNQYSMNSYSPKGLFGYAENATFKNLTLSDVYIDNVQSNGAGALLGRGAYSLIIDNVKTYGKMSQELVSDIFLFDGVGGIVGKFSGNGYGYGIKIENVENNISPVDTGIIGSVEDIGASDSPNIIFNNVTNNGDFTSTGGISNYITGSWNNGAQGYLSFNNVVNKGNLYDEYTNGSNQVGGLVGGINVNKSEIKNSNNTGNITCPSDFEAVGGLVGALSSTGGITFDNCYNSGNITSYYQDSYADGLTSEEITNIRRYHVTFDMGGIVGRTQSYQSSTLIKDSFNSGTLKGFNSRTGGIIGDHNENGDNITIQDSYNIGDIYAGYGDIGGIIAITKGTINNCHNSGDITLWGIERAYDLNGTSYSGDSVVGGLVGDHTNLTISSETTGARIIDSYNEGDIIITAKINSVAAGGLCALCQDISGSHNSGNITATYATQYFNGLGVRVLGNTTDSYNEGTITPGSGY